VNEPQQASPNLPQELGSSREEFTNRHSDLGGMRFQGEVTGIVEADIGVGDVPLERLCARRKEERVVLSPHRQKARLVLAEVRLERWVKRNVALVITEQVQLDLIGSGARQVEVVQRSAVRLDRGLVGHAMGVLPACRLRCQEGAKRPAILL